MEHLIPSQWYMQELIYQHGGEWKFVIGASMPGIPAVLIGRTQYAAFGYTNSLADTSDLFLEQFSPLNESYLFEGSWVPAHKFTEKMKVKGSTEPLTLTVYKTHHGNLLNYVQNHLNKYTPTNFNATYSYAWSGMQDSTGATLTAMIGMLLASNLTALQKAVDGIAVPALNLVYATSDNHIGYQSTGKYPIKHGPTDLRIRDGTDHASDWLGYYPTSQAPRLVDPAKGYIIAANNRIGRARASETSHASVASLTNATAHASVLERISAAIPCNARARRIESMLDEVLSQKKQKLRFEDHATIQRDVVDPFCQLTLSAILSLFDKHSARYYADRELRQSIEGMVGELRGWDCQMVATGPGAVAAAVFNVWEHELYHQLFQQLSDDQTLNFQAAYHPSLDGFIFQKLLAMGQDDRREGAAGADAANADAVTADAVTADAAGADAAETETTSAETTSADAEEYCEVQENKYQRKKCLWVFFHAFEKAHAWLASTLSPSRDKWEWGKLLQVIKMHTSMSGTNLQSKYEIPKASEGNRRTVNYEGVNLYQSTFRSISGANLRLIMDLEDESDSYYIMDTGISENIFTDYYKDQLTKFEKGQYNRLLFGLRNWNSYEIESRITAAGRGRSEIIAEDM